MEAVATTRAIGARRMDGKTQIEVVGGFVGSLLGLTTIYNTVALRREAARQREADADKKRDAEAILATQETIQHLRDENGRLWARLGQIDKDFEAFKAQAAERDRVQTADLSAARAEVERNRGQLVFLRREVMAVFARIASAIKKADPQSELAVSVSAEMAAFVQSVQHELGPLGEAPVIIGNDGAERRLGE